ncbi:porin family protein [Algoriphagus sediminis]|uniref:Porin family protein n=1 Tax=Algoriphagus sediminis TaxID=3057113 RepID=A0ABT7YE46_9BACT|nr:porin family protein [Algoriphagus sediminis]MDN3204796.1 porin family protein [Algoriphagus sediminis]
MKKILFSLVLIFAANETFGQEVRLNTYAGYVFKNRVDSYFSNSSYYDGTIQDGFRWGAGIEYLIPQKGAVELQYLRQDTNAPTTYRDGGILNGEIQFTDFDLAINWIFVNGTKYFPVNEVVEPFAGGGIGMAIFGLDNPDNGRSSSATKLAWNIKGGSNFWLADNVALRVQASLMSAVQSVGGGFYFGTGGSGAGLSTYSSMYQFAFEGGIVFRIPQGQ